MAITARDYTWPLNMASGVESLLSKTTVDLSLSTKQTLFTAPANYDNVVITRIVLASASASLTTAILGFGWDASAINVSAAAALSGLTGSTLYSSAAILAASTLGAASGVFGAKTTVTQAATVVVYVYGMRL